jgi:hypothetical protein
MSATFEGKVIDELCMHWAQRLTEAREIPSVTAFLIERSSTNSACDGSFSKLQVKMHGDEMRAFSRKGY